jgi:hypothetical protein
MDLAAAMLASADRKSVATYSGALPFLSGEVG